MFNTALVRHGSLEKLFSAPLTYSDEAGRIKFDFPDWMTGIRSYLIGQYGESAAGRLMLDLMAEWMTPRHTQPGHSEGHVELRQGVRFSVDDAHQEEIPLRWSSNF